jgi:hypothetical protein
VLGQEIGTAICSRREGSYSDMVNEELYHHAIFRVHGLFLKHKENVTVSYISPMLVSAQAVPFSVTF